MSYYYYRYKYLKISKYIIVNFDTFPFLSFFRTVSSFPSMFLFLDGVGIHVFSGSNVHILAGCLSMEDQEEGKPNREVESVQDTIPNNLIRNIGDISAFVAAPSDWIQDPEEGHEAKSHAVFSARDPRWCWEVGTANMSVEMEQNEEHGEDPDGEETPFVIRSYQSADQSTHNRSSCQE